MHPAAGRFVFRSDHLAADAHPGQAVERLGQALLQAPEDAGSQAPLAPSPAWRLLYSLIIMGTARWLTPEASAIIMTD